MIPPAPNLTNGIQDSVVYTPHVTASDEGIGNGSRRILQHPELSWARRGPVLTPPLLVSWAAFLDRITDRGHEPENCDDREQYE
jgi:hypothetical protein